VTKHKARGGKTVGWTRFERHESPLSRALSLSTTGDGNKLYLPKEEKRIKKVKKRGVNGNKKQCEGGGGDCSER
jgi:hypothetical protein